MKGQSCEIVRITIFTMQLIFSNTKVKEYLQTGAFRVKFRWRQFLCGFRRITLFDWISNETPSLNFISYWPYDIIPGIRLILTLLRWLGVPFEIQPKEAIRQNSRGKLPFWLNFKQNASIWRSASTCIFNSEKDFDRFYNFVLPPPWL